MRRSKMMKKNKLLLVLMSLLLTGCGSEINNIISGRVDHSTNWNDNYYTKWDSGLNDVEFVSDISRELDENDQVFRGFEDETFKRQVAPQDYRDYNYYSEDPSDSYGLNKCLSNYNESFKKNFSSKLFDGKMFCLARYEAVRVQIKESGIGINFGCKLSKDNYDYFALQFKSSLDFKQHSPDVHFSSIKLKISFYSEKDGFHNKETLFYTLDNVLSNTEAYIFFGFSLTNIELPNIYGCSIEYELVSDEYNDAIEKEEDKLEHALLLYELLMPNTIWK